MTPSGSPHARRLLAECVLVGITFIWGTTFVITKETLDTIPAHTLVAWRFALGSLLVGMGRFAWRGDSGVKVNWRAIALPSAVLGVLLFIGFETQTVGLRFTSATKSAFITGTVTLWVPVMTWLFLGKRHGADLWLGVPMGCVGLFLLTLSGTGAQAEGLAWGWGEALTLVCAFGFAGHIILTQRWSPGIPTGALALIQLGVVTALSFAGAVIAGEPILPDAPMRAWLSVAYLALFPTAIVFWAQAKFQPLTTEERAAIIFLLEPVFAAVVAWIVLEEMLDSRQWIGAGMITIAAVLPAIAALASHQQQARGHADQPMDRP